MVKWRQQNDHEYEYMNVGCKNWVGDCCIDKAGIGNEVAFMAKKVKLAQRITYNFMHIII